MRADVYRDSTHGGLSVINMETGSENYGTVVDHVETVRIENASVEVYESKRKAAVESGTDNMHVAFRGELERVDSVTPEGTELRYHRDKPGCFYTAESDERVDSADVVLISLSKGVYAKGVETQ